VLYIKQIGLPVMKHGLIDEYDLLTFPIVLGTGRRLFGEGINIPLQLIESKAFSSGVILSRYEPVGSGSDTNPAPP
jgi:dihydrofolate reductase